MLAFIARAGASILPTRYGLAIASLFLFCVIYGFAFGLTAPFLLMPFLVPPFILLLLIVWALPDSRAPVRSLTFFFFAFYISSVIWPNYIAIALPGLPWITMIRLTSFPLFLIFMICLSVSSEFRARFLQSINTISLIWKLLLFFVVIQLISIAFSPHVAESINKFVIAQTTWTAMFFISCYIFLTPKRPVLWAALLWGMAIFVGLIGIWENKLGRLPWVGHIPGFLKIDDPSVIYLLAGVTRASVGIHRVQSTSSTPLGLSEYIAFTMPFILHFTAPIYRLAIRIAAVASVPFLIYVAILSQSRLGIIGCLLTALGFILVTSITSWLRNRDSMFSLATILAYPVGFAATVAATFVVGRIRNVVWGNAAQGASNDARVVQYAQGMPMVWSHPWGHGIGMGAETLGFYVPSGLLTIDTYYLAVALEYGILGFIIYYGLFVAGIVYAARYALLARNRSGDYLLFLPISLALTNFLVIKSVFSQQDNHPLIFIMLGMLVALACRLRSEAPDNAQGKQSPKLRGRA